MSRLIWSSESLQDIKRLYDFLANENVEVAKKAILKIKKTSVLLEQHPEMGKPRVDMGLTYRELLISFGISGYVLLYRHEQDVCIVLAIRHQRELGYFH